MTDKTEQITITLEQFCQLFSHASAMAERMIEDQIDLLQEGIGLVGRTNQNRQKHDEHAEEFTRLYLGCVEDLKAASETGRRIIEITRYLDDFGLENEEVEGLRKRLEILVQYAGSLSSKP